MIGSSVPRNTPRRPLSTAGRNVERSQRNPKQGVSVHHDGVSARKRARSPCADEVLYRNELLPRHQALVSRHEELSTTLFDLCQTVSSFYFAHMIEEEQPASDCVGEGSTVVHKAPRSRVGYYHTSTTAKARSARATLCRQQQDERLQLEAKIAQMEEDVQRTVVNGVLATQRATTEAEEQALAHRQDILRQCQATTSSLREDIISEKAKLPVIEAEVKACQDRIRLLEERKKRQMDNVEQTRQELAQQREQTSGALREWQRRQQNVEALEKEIDRRRQLLRRAKHRD